MNRDAALDEAILHPDLRHINFFNGRLLTGGDLEAEQNVQHTHARHLGRAIGAGVASGLRVAEAAASPSGEVAVVVTAGLAVNRAGATLCLEGDQRVVFARPPDPTRVGQCVFADCEDHRASGLIANGTGYYVLTIASASLREGRAPVSGLGNALATCNSRYFSEGVMFRLLPLTVAGLPTNPALVRSFIAHQCLGLLHPTAYERVTRAGRGLPPVKYGYETMIPAGWLTDDDVPLAIVEWTAGGIGFIDEWSVRRRVARASADALWDSVGGDCRLAQGEAVFAQFQQQMAEILQTGSGTTRAAAQDFVALPPVGIVPVRDTGSAGGVDLQTFLGSFGSTDVALLEAEGFGALRAQSCRHQPVALQSGTRFQRYALWESIRGVETGAPGARLEMVFASAALPYAGVARFGYSRRQLGRFSFAIR